MNKASDETDPLFFSSYHLQFILQAVPRPRNDNCENATEFLSLPMSKSGSTFGALWDRPLDICSSSTNNRGVWYAVTPSFARNITVATSVASFHHEIVLFSGDSCDTATCDGVQNATYSSKASITFVAGARKKYFILVTGYNGIYDAFDQDGTFTLKITGDGSDPTGPTNVPVENIVPAPTKAPLPVVSPTVVVHPSPPVSKTMKHMKGMMFGKMKMAARTRNYNYAYGRGGMMVALSMAPHRSL